MNGNMQGVRESLVLHLHLLRQESPCAHLPSMPQGPPHLPPSGLAQVLQQWHGSGTNSPEGQQDGVRHGEASQLQDNACAGESRCPRSSSSRCSNAGSISRRLGGYIVSL